MDYHMADAPPLNLEHGELGPSDFEKWLGPILNSRALTLLVHAPPEQIHNRLLAQPLPENLALRRKLCDVEGNLLPLHPYSDQIMCTDKPYQHLCWLYSPPEQLFPNDDINEQTSTLLERWVDKQEFEGVLRLGLISATRQFLTSLPPPPEPLKTQIFWGSHLKVFVNRNIRRDESAFTQLTRMWIPEDSQPSSLSHDLVARDQSHAERLQKHLEQPFIGNGADQFFQGMKTYNDLWAKHSDQYYGRLVAIVAPSGMGKTKVTLEHLSKNAGLYICLRNADDLAAHGWPPGDPALTQYFAKHAQRPTALVAATVIAALLTQALKTWTALDAHNTAWKLRSGSRIGRKDPRTENLYEVAATAEALLSRHEDEFRAAIAEGATAGDYARTAVKLICELPAQALAQKIPNFAIVVDECTSMPLLFPPHQVSPLLRVMECLSDHALWFILASTSSKITSIVPSMDVKASQRFPNQMSLPPWFYLPFDPYLTTRRPVDTVAQSLELNELKQFGRPLWRIYADQEVLGIARTKLMGRSVSSPPLSESEIFAVFSQRICLRLHPSPSSQLIELTAVESHLRLATGIHAGMLITSCPSEPVLALAAATTVNSTPAMRQHATQALVSLVAKYRVDRGLEGELYSRLVLVMARDAATNNFVEQAKGTPSLQTVTLAAMLQALIKDNAIPANSENFYREIGSDVHITFTHFLELDVDIGILDSAWCYEMFCRGAAAQCTFCQPVIDGLIIGYRGDLSQPFDETKLFLFCYQAKARAQAPSTALSQGLTCPMLRYKDGTLVKPDHLVILIDMATTTTFTSGARVQVSKRAAKVPSGNGKDWTGYAAAHGETENPGHLLIVRGLDPYAVFTGIDLHKLYESISPEGPLETLFGPSSRGPYSNLTHCIPKSQEDSN
ncbi:hypothetical protein C8F04DRAFT_1058215 [Mycena alexandri]|uniref:Uncharacterized protein n=1 Tax=Mycena alexandri TaxID=1745969 RepID=A0AAD6XCD6_9AGAR|nr:hypothetical protein C8F04DRAFT_1058215 [Mycena alexandri]